MSLTDKYNNVMKIVSDKKQLAENTYELLLGTIEQLFNESEDKGYKILRESDRTYKDGLQHYIVYSTDLGTDGVINTEISIESSGEVCLTFEAHPQARFDITGYKPEVAAAKILFAMAEIDTGCGNDQIRQMLNKATEAFSPKVPSSQPLLPTT